jgi:molybdopterin-guanine dinucleotide biosynthesis protein B
MPFLFSISGYHNAGKTTLALSLYEILKNRGYKIAVVKSSKEKDIFTDIPEKDTWHYRKKGVPLVGFFQENLFTLYLNPENFDLSSFKDWYVYFQSLFWNFNIVILEGFKNFDMVNKIWVVKEKDEDLKRIKSEIRNLLGFVVKDDLERWKSLYPEEKFFLFKDYETLANFIEELIKKYEPRVLLKINNKKIPMKSFVEDALIYPLLGFIKVLKDVPDEIEDIEIKIKLNEKLDKEEI